MKQLLGRLTVALAMIFIVQLATASAQTTGAVAGTVLDSNGAVVPNATVTVKGQAGQEFTATTAGNGTYNIPAVAAGLYSVTITATGFKTSITENVKVDAGVPATVDAALTAGNVSETVVVTGGAEVLQTQTATVGTNIQGRQIVETPIQSRDALDLIVLLPGTNTIGTVRTSTVNGLPKGALSISIDGADVQDSLLRSSDGFFTYVRPRIDAIDEVTISTSNPGAESSGDGAVQIKFITRRGTNEYTGGLFFQHRDEGLNANYFFNNRDLLPIDGKAPKNKIRLNQFGGRIGGPIPFLNFGQDDDSPTFNSGKNKRFFFVNYEEFRLPEASPTRVRTILNTRAQSGFFNYVAGGVTREVNLFNLAGLNGLPNTPDPTIAALLTRIRASTSGTGSITPAPGDVNRERFNFVNQSNSKRTFLAARVDFNLTKNHSLENVFNRQPFRSDVDLLNGLDPAFPGFENAGTQNSDRYSNSTALRSSFGQNIVNEARFGRLWGKSGFTLVGGPEFFAQTQAGFTLNIAQAGITNATIRNAAQIRESPTNDFTDNLTWIRGSHTFTFGGQYKVIGLTDDNRPQFVPTVGFGIVPTDPALAVFNTTNFPGASAAQLTEAQNLYATLTGRVATYTQTGYLGADGQYTPSGPQLRKIRQRTYGLFAQDTWRVRTNLTINLGIRWQPQEGYEVLSDNFARLENPEQVFDVSGVGNLFSPGTLTGQAPRAVQVQKGEKAFPTDFNNFAPTIGVVWSPNFGEGFLTKVLGRNSVIRGGFGRAFVREGTNLAGTVFGNNPGGNISLSRSTTLNNLTIGTLLRTPGNPNLVPPTFDATPTYPRTITSADNAFAFSQDLKTGYVDSFSFGYQRELDNNTVIEFRYVGNRGKDIFRLYSQNEVNAIENGFGNEFRLAQTNLRANQAAGRGNTFAYFGAGTGTSPLPILLSYIRGAGDPTVAANYNSTLFANATLYNTLAISNPNVQGLAAILEQNFRATGTGAGGRPVNFFNNCPTTLGFCYLLDNSEISSYDSAVIELRRRLSSGLRVQASYVYAKAFTNSFAGATGSGGFAAFSAAAADQNNNASVSLRNPDLDHSPAQIDLRHAFKFDATYDLPFGKGQQFFSGSNGFVNALIGGFTLVPTIRWQSGSPFLLENVQLVGMTVEELQKAIKVNKNATVVSGSITRNVVTYLPDDIILNTKRAFNVSATTANGYGTTFGGAPTGRFIAPAGYDNCQAKTAGECGFRRLVLYGPNFFKMDLAVLKRFQFKERRNVELKATFFDVLNKTNFRVGGWTGNFTNVTAFGDGFGELGPGTAYQDPFGSNDPGGRLVDLTLRINF